MKKSSFAAMILGAAGGILLSVGLCMCLIPEWNAFNPGVIAACAGFAVIIIMTAVWRRMSKKNPVHMSGRTFGAVILGGCGALLFGAGMSCVMVWNRMVPGITAGSAGIIMLLSLIPVIKGLK